MTDRYVIMGNPVEHSLSPAIQEFFARRTGERMVYERLLVPAGGFGSTAARFFAEGGRGCNITVPCKLDACAFASALTPYAAAAGAVNTLRLNPDGSVLGDNTDGRGLVADLERLRIPLTGRRILIIGAGGAARGILRPLLEKDPRTLALVNRDEAKARALAADNPGVELERYRTVRPGYDLIINATSASLQGVLPPLNPEVLAGAGDLYDLMYSPSGQTVFTREGARLGAAVHDGLGMLLGQAALSFELWRGIRPGLEEAWEHFAAALGR